MQLGFAHLALLCYWPCGDHVGCYAPNQPIRHLCQSALAQTMLVVDVVALVVEQEVFLGALPHSPLGGLVCDRRSHQDHVHR